MNRHPTVLVVVRLANMTVLHPDQDSTRTCSRCAEAVGIFPSGQAVLALWPDVAIICDVCYQRGPPPDEVYLAPGARDDMRKITRRQ